jgi:hypothetical protein
MKHFVSDLEKIRERAHMHMEAGAVTEGDKADREQLVAVLKMCWRPKRNRGPLVQGTQSQQIGLFRETRSESAEA